MNTKKYQLIFYFITATIVATIAVQFFWNYKNYEENKEQKFCKCYLYVNDVIRQKHIYVPFMEKTDENLETATKVGVDIAANKDALINDVAIIKAIT